MRLFAIATLGLNRSTYGLFNRRSESVTKNLISQIEMEIEALRRKLTPVERKIERIKQLADDLRGGRKVTDFRFDQVYPSEIRKISERHWTPVRVAIRATELLVKDSRTRILDVGSGAGKFCIVGALSSPGQFIGVEQRPYLTEVAREATDTLCTTGASFILGNMVDLDWSFFDAFYLFNPFYEHKMRSIWIDATVSLNEEKFNHYVEVVRAKLRCARIGTRVATYHGFGGDMPLGYQLVQKEFIGTSHLELWVKAANPS